MNPNLLALAQDVVAQAKASGADEVSVSVSSGSHVTLQRRARKVEQCTEATTRGLVLSILADDRYTSNSTTDLRPDALSDFVQRSVAAARYLEPDPFRRLPPGARCGRGVSEEHLDHDDPAWARRTPADRHAQAEALEDHLLSLGGKSLVSCTATLSDERDEGVRVMSNGFADATGGAWFSLSAEATLEDGEKRPEGFSHYASRHLGDLPAIDGVAAECIANVRERIGAKPVASGTYPMILENRVAGRVLGMLAGPLSGSTLHEGRSCLDGRLGTAIASPILSLVDDPTVPRGMSSRPWDSDGFPSVPRPIIEAGVLRTYYISQYYSGKLGAEPTTAGRSNWVLAPGTRPYAAMAKDLDRAIRVTGFLGGSANSATGDFSFGIRGQLLEGGEVVAGLSEMNVSGNLLRLLHQLHEVGNDPWTYSATRSPSMVFLDVQFSGT